MLKHQNLDSKEPCLETIAPKTCWLVEIGNKSFNLDYLKYKDLFYEEFTKCREKPMIIDLLFHNSMSLIERSLTATEKNYFLMIEEDPLSKYDFIELVSILSPLTLLHMAKHLSGHAIDTISSKIFSKKGVNDLFVNSFYIIFIPYYVKRKYSWYTLHFFIKASKAYPRLFMYTFKSIMYGTYTPNTMLKDYIGTLDATSCTELMTKVIEKEFGALQFDYNLPILYLLYKNCVKNDYIFEYIYSHLNKFNYYCRFSKEYGRLLLYFIEHMSEFNFCFRAVTEMAINHFTSYKGPCLAALDVYRDDNIAMQLMDVNEQPRIVIPRPQEKFRL